MDELYVFGYGNSRQFPNVLGPDDERPGHLQARSLSTPTCTLRGRVITILWASWCDLIVSITDTNNTTTISYYGASLSPPQITTLTTIPSNPLQPPIFFGRRDTLGVLGFIQPAQRSLTHFHTLEETARGADPATTYALDAHSFDILGVHFTASATAFVSIARRADAPGPSPPEDEEAAEGNGYGNGMLIALPSLQHLLPYLEEKKPRSPSKSITTPPSTPPQPPFTLLAPFSPTPTQITTNTATLTILHPTTRTPHTHPTDPRYPLALGRRTSPSPSPSPPPPQHTATTTTAKPIPYLTQTPIAKLAAGGLYTAALSTDEELYLWGHAASGSDAAGELRCLPLSPRNNRDSKTSADGADDDDFTDAHVATLEFRIDGHVARVSDVGVGFAHVVVAVECGRENGQGDGEGGVKSAVFAAGDNRDGALGLGEEMNGTPFVEDWMEVEALRGKRIKQLVCAGMSSYVVVEAEA